MPFRTGISSVRSYVFLVCKRSSSQVGKDISKASQTAPTAHNPMESVEVKHAATNFDKRLLASLGFYPSSDKVPAFVPRSQMEKCRNIVRVRGTALIMACALLGAFITSVLGKKQAHAVVEEVKRENP